MSKFLFVFESIVNFTFLSSAYFESKKSVKSASNEENFVPENDALSVRMDILGFDGSCKLFNPLNKTERN